MEKVEEFNTVINRLGTYSTQWDYVEDRFGKSDLLPFTISDTDFAAPHFIIKSLKKRIEHPVFGYTRWNHRDYKGVIVEWFKKQFDTKIDEKWVVYSPSVVYSISRMIELHSNEGNGVIIQTPAYDAFFKTIKASKRVVVENPFAYENGTYKLDLDHLTELIRDKNNKVLLLCSPHNPTGIVWEQSELEQIINLCRENGVYIISDEIHMDVVRGGKKHIPIIRVADELNQMALCSSPSKTFNIPGLGGSYLIIPDEDERAEFLNQLKDRDGVSSASILGIEATMAAYTQGSQWVSELNEYFTDNLQYVKEFLADEIPELTFSIPESTYLAWIDISGLPFTMEEVQEALINVGKVAIMNGEVYGGNGGQFLRLNVGCPRSKLIEGLERLKISINHLKENN